MSKLFNQDYSLVHPHITIDRDRPRVAKQIYTVLKNVNPAFNFSKAKCLDLGSSSGIIAKAFIKYVHSIECLDTDSKAIVKGQKLYADQKLKFRLFDGKKIPFPDQTFDLIIFRRTLEYSENPEKLIKEIKRLLKPKGLVYLEVQNLLFPTRLMPIKFKKILIEILKPKNYYLGDYKTSWQLEKLLKSFQIIKLTPEITHYPQQFQFTQLYSYSFLRKIPLSVHKWVEPFMPYFIWVLQSF